jgi:hypothetical protein
LGASNWRGVKVPARVPLRRDRWVDGMKHEYRNDRFFRELYRRAGVTSEQVMTNPNQSNPNQGNPNQPQNKPGQQQGGGQGKPGQQQGGGQGKPGQQQQGGGQSKPGQEGSQSGYDR